MKIPIVAEKIEEDEIWLLKFLTDVLWIEYIQWFIFTKNEENINDYVEWKGAFA